MSIELMAALKVHDLNERHPQTAKSLRKYFLAAAMKAEFTNPFVKVLIAVPLLGIGTVSPLPGDISTAFLLLASTCRQAKAFIHEVIEEVDGTLEQKQFQAAVNCMTDKSDPQKYLTLDAVP